MKNYEIAFLLKEGEHIPETKERIKSYFSKTNGSFLSEEDMGLRELAYPIHKRRETFHKAYYWFVKAQLNSEKISELEKIFKYDESIIRFMLLVE